MDEVETDEKSESEGEDGGKRKRIKVE